MQSTAGPPSPRKKLKSPFQDVINPRTCITCSNVPDLLFDPTAAKKHFSKFGRVQKIRLFAKRHMCIIEYDQPSAADKALLNAGAYDGFMFDVTRSKARMRRRSSKKEDDPDWVPDSDVEEELSAMGGAPTYRVTRPKPVTSEASPKQAVQARKLQIEKLARQHLLAKKKVSAAREKPVVPASATIVEPVTVVTTQTNMSTSEAASELCQLRTKVSLTPDEQWRVLEVRDRILRAWGGAGSRIKMGGATIGTCQDMCPEKELLQRQSEHQVMTLETVVGSDGELEPWRAVKQYSRSSADQEIPMCYELRPAKVLMRTCAYLLHEVADTDRQVSLADWFHFMWDRFRGIRKDITQQALCCADSICLVEMCARFHAHCAARLADLEHTQFDQKLNTDNLTKCLQTLKHMYADVSPEQKPREAEFRGYVALLNLGDANFWWEIQQLPEAIQKSEPILFAIKVFNAIDNNNYVRFFRLVKNEATYLQACILLRYFNDVRARGLARIVKAYAPRGGSRYPAEDMIRTLAFESVENLNSFINHYGLRFARTDDSELSVILDRNQFIEDSDPYPISRAINLIESKRNCSVGEIIAGGSLPDTGYSQHVLYTSFTHDGKLKETALAAEDQDYNTRNDSNKDIQALKAEIKRLSQGGKSIPERMDTKVNMFKSEMKSLSPKSTHKFMAPENPSPPKMFSFKPAIQVAPGEVIKSSPEKIVGADKNIFSFSKPQNTPVTSTIFVGKEPVKSLFDKKPVTSNVFAKSNSEKVESSNSLFGNTKSDNIFGKKPDVKPVFGQLNDSTTPKNLFGGVTQNVFLAQDKDTKSQPSFGGNNVFSANSESKSVFGAKNIFASKDKVADNQTTMTAKNIFAEKAEKPNETKTAFGAKNIFGTKEENNLVKPAEFGANNIFGSNKDKSTDKQSVFGGTNIFAAKDENKTEQQNVFGAKNIFSSAKTDLFSKPAGSGLEKGGNVFGKQAESSGNEPKASSSNIFGTFGQTSESTAIFAKPEGDKPQGFFSNGETRNDVSPGGLFKSVINSTNGPDAKAYSVFQSKNKAQTVADNILNSITTTQAPSVYDFEQNDEDRKQLELHRQEVERIKEEERKLQEKIKKEEEMRKLELKRQDEERQREELRKKQEEVKLLEEKRRKEEQRKQEELKKKLEEEKKAELKRQADEERKFQERVERESITLTEELIDEINNEIVKSIMREEYDKYNSLMKLAEITADELITNLSSEICESEMKAEDFLTRKIRRKWFNIWIERYARNIKRRHLLDDTPVWLTGNTPNEEAAILKRIVENVALQNMNAIHRGYRFKGELVQLRRPEPYNIMEIIRSPLLKRMKQINYPYDKCFFWKVTLVSPGSKKWLYRKVDVHKWLLDAFSDGKKHEVSNTLIHVGKQSWNHLMDFAISVSITSNDQVSDNNEAVDGTNALLFYATEHDYNLLQVIEESMQYKYPYQMVPVAVIIPVMETESLQLRLEKLLADLVIRKTISAYRIFVISSNTVSESLNATTKSALKWLAKKYPVTPPLEIDCLKSICERYLGNEIWCRLKTDRDGRMNVVLKDLHKLVKCYNIAVDKLTHVITNEDLFNYSTFPLEFQPYLESMSPYPKPYEFIPSSVRTSDNVSCIKRIMNQLKLPDPSSEFNPINAITMQQQITTYCNQIGWFENPDEVVCKVVAVIPNELSNVSMPTEDFRQYYAQYDLLDFMNIIVYEKISHLKNFENKFAIYEKSVLEDYRSALWLHEVNIINELKHKALEYEDEVDYYIEAKRRKIEMDSLECLMLEDKDKTLVEENIKENDVSISKYDNCTEAVQELEQLLEKEKIKSLQFENMLRAALHDL